MNKPISYKRQDTCPKCYTPHSIELFNINNQPIGYTNILNNHEYNILEGKRLLYMQCKKCGYIFMINWNTNNHIPIPADENDLNIFEDKYKKFTPDIFKLKKH